ncbi:MAG TPA: hypothetical protein VF173_32190 [Thermoanaerobaculia bacterium]|nr:hypothetical protein [Thermoanaerobaculia bacterium]
MAQTEFPYPPLQALAAVANPPIFDHLRALHASQDRSALLAVLEAELASTNRGNLASLVPAIPKALICCAALLAHHGANFLPVPGTVTIAYHWYHSLMITRVLQNLHRSWPPPSSFHRAADHLVPLRGTLLVPATHLTVLRDTRCGLADLGVYLSFGWYLAITGHPDQSANNTQPLKEGPASTSGRERLNR